MNNHSLDAFQYGYQKGYQDRVNHLSRQMISNEGSVHVMVMKLGYDLGFEHAISFACAHNEAQNTLLDAFMS